MVQKRLSILLIDDDAGVRRAAKRALLHEFDVLDVADGAEAIQALRSGRFDAVVTDLVMPNVDGAGVVAWLERYQPALVERVVIMTGGASTATRQAWLDAWKGELVAKPCSAKDLARAIRRVAGGES